MMIDPFNHTFTSPDGVVTVNVDQAEAAINAYEHILDMVFRPVLGDGQPDRVVARSIMGGCLGAILKQDADQTITLTENRYFMALADVLVETARQLRVLEKAVLS